MTKEQVEKHREVMKWFIDHPDKGVWYQAGLSKKWFLIYHPDFSVDLEYIQNDEYAEFRKALADGKQLQFKTTYDNGRTQLHNIPNLKPTSEFDYELEYYIKPDEPKFKLGDWVRDISPENSGIRRITTEDQLEQANSDSALIKWEPKPGELCVFWDSGTAEYFIGRYGTEALSNTYGVNHGSAMYIKDDWGNAAPLEYVKMIKDNA